MKNPKFTNKLVEEKSPYLLQHAHNPVNWYPWGEAAFKIAMEQNKPVLVSIGYATCHWCHVMERESFESEETAQYMNEHFICIKVDREERPDVDQLYMQCVQAMGKQGGWPLNVFVTPYGIPFYGGTYFPPTARYGISSFQDVLAFLNNIWLNEHDKVEKQGTALVKYLKEHSLPEPGGQEDGLHFGGAERTVQNFEQSFDNLNYGFKFQPQNKFPPSMGLSFLLRHHHRTGYEKCLIMAETTLRAMKYGGIYDQIGGGLSRYSTDYRWLVPHFEKMLYDNALFITALIETYQVNGKQEYAEWALDVLEYIDRDMTSPEGGFYSAEDADSEGIEGKFYVWTKAEIEKLLDRQTASIAMAYYNVSESGNWEHKNILNVTQPIAEFAKEQNLPEDTIFEHLAKARTTLLEERCKRIRPLLDDKILTSWNSLMISAYAKVGRVLDNVEIIGKAEKALEFIFQKLWTADGRLLRRYREGQARYNGYLFDYSTLAVACLDVYEATYQTEYLDRARQLMQIVIDRFPADNGAYYETASDAEDLIVRQITAYDGVEPSGNSSAAMAFLRLSAYDVNPEWEKRGVKILLAFLDDIMEYGLNSPYMMQVSHLYLSGVKEVAVVGPRNHPSTKEMWRFIRSEFMPHSVVAFAYEDEIASTKVTLLKDRKVVDGKATAYVCNRGTCLSPVTSIEGLKKLLEEDYREQN